ncbi:MAG: hypothetical protein ACSLE1_20225 [Sphingobium sp.]
MAGAISLSLLMAVLINYSFVTPETRVRAFFSGFDLGKENNLAAWWSAALLMVCASNFASLLQERRAGLQLPWLVLALMFTLLSLDEIGSLHERETSFSAGPGQMVMVIVAGLLVTAGAYSGLRLLICRETRALAILLAIAMMLYASVVLQEFIEHRVSWPAWTGGLRVMIEEGTELTACFLVLVGITKAKAVGDRGRWLDVLPIIDPTPAVRFCLLGLLALHMTFCLSYITSLDDFRRYGNPAGWFPLVAYLLIACHVARREARHMKKSDMWLIGFALLCSILAAFDVTEWWPLSSLPWTREFTLGSASISLVIASVGSGYVSRRSAPVAALFLTISIATMVLPFHHALAGLGAYLAAELLVMGSATSRSGKRALSAA